TGRPHCRLDRPLDPGPGLRVPAGHGQRGCRPRPAPGRRVLLAVAGTPAGALPRRPPARTAGGRAARLGPAGDASDRAAQGTAPPDAPAVRPQLPALPARPGGLHAGECERCVPAGAGRGTRRAHGAAAAAVVRLPRRQEHRQHAAGHAVDQFGPRPFVCLGWFVYAGVYLAFALATTAWQVWVFFLAYGLIIGLIEPAERALVANLVGGERKGLAY